ncbi:2-oxoglutarate and iron-dependent oxygenase JMJD4-like isoform X2 [Dysidea avara]
MEQFLHYWKADQQDRQQQPAGDENRKEEEERRILYLKDWHYAKQYSNSLAYTLPVIFSSDWLNEYWASRTDVDDDYKFVYMGPKGSWTPFHADVLRSYSWLTIICGCKDWILFPPGEEDYLRDKLGNLPFDVGTDYPPQCHPLHVILNSGETIFVPSGWHHQVMNLEDTICINYNWSNACNLDKMFDHLKRSLEEVKKEISDCRSMEGWNQQCQLILKATTGMDYNELCDYLLCIGEVRLHEREQAILRLKGTQPLSQTNTTRSCDMSCDILTTCDMTRQRSHTPLLHQYLPDFIRTIVLQDSPVMAELYCTAPLGATDLAVVAYRSYELNNIESVLSELVNSEVMDETKNGCKERILKFLQDLNKCV